MAQSGQRLAGTQVPPRSVLNTYQVFPGRKVWKFKVISIDLTGMCQGMLCIIIHRGDSRMWERGLPGSPVCGD